MVYLSPSRFHDAFEEEFFMLTFNPGKHTTVGLVLEEIWGKLYLREITPGTPAAKIKARQSQQWGEWFIEVDGTPVCTVDEVKAALLSMSMLGKK